MNALTQPGYSKTNLVPKTTGEHFPAILERWVSQQPHQMAYGFTDVETPPQTLTYTELWDEICGLAGHLQSRCRIRSGDRVLLIYPPSLEFLIGFFACHAIGAVAVPAYPPRRNRKASRIRSIVVDAGAKWALSNSTTVDGLKTNQQHDDLIGVQLLATDSSEARDPESYRQPKITSETLAVLQYTSGSTGSPKGVMLDHRNLITNSDFIRRAFELNEETVGASWLPTYHDMGLVGGVLSPLFIGRPCILMSPMTFLQRPVRWLRAISENGVTISGGPNFAYQLCVDKISPEEAEGLDLSCWKSAFNGAEPIRASTLNEFAEKFEPYGFKRNAALPCYGMAETTLLVTGGPSEGRPIFTAFEASALDEGRVRVIETRNDGKPFESTPAGGRVLVACGKQLPEEEILIV
ncbi:MAG: AMP-binding protein, partial [Planctomycetota bacterium]